MFFSDASRYMSKIYYPVDVGMDLQWLNERVEQFLGEEWVGKVRYYTV